MNRKRKRKILEFVKNPLVIVCFIYFVLYTALTLSELYFGVFSSFKSHSELRKSVFAFPKGWPWEWHWENYAIALSNFDVKVTSANGVYFVGIGEQLWNTAYYGVVSSLVCATVTMCVAYATACYNYKFNDVLVGCYWASVIIPIVGNGASGMQIFRSLGLYNNMYLFCIVSRFTFLSINFLYFRAIFKNVNGSYREAALLDGANEFQILVKIMIPQAMHLFVVVFFLGVISLWDEYSSPLLYFPSYPTIAVGLYKLNLSTETAVSSSTVKLAACIVTSIPTLIFYFFFRKKLIVDVSLEGVKE